MGVESVVAGGWGVGFGSAEFDIFCFEVLCPVCSGVQVTLPSLVSRLT